MRTIKHPSIIQLKNFIETKDVCALTLFGHKRNDLTFLHDGAALFPNSGAVRGRGAVPSNRSTDLF